MQQCDVKTVLILSHVFVYCVYLFFRMSSRCVVVLQKKRDRWSGAALRSQERALLGKKVEEEEMLLMMRIMLIMTRCAG